MHPRAHGLSPHDGLAAVAGMAEVVGLGYVGDVTPHHFGIAAVPVASQHKRFAAQVLPRAVGALESETIDQAVGSGIKGIGMGIGDDVDAGPRHGGAQRADQIGAVDTRRVNVHDHFARPRGGIRVVAVIQEFRSALLVQECGFHRLLVLVFLFSLFYPCHQPTRQGRSKKFRSRPTNLFARLSTPTPSRRLPSAFGLC